MGASLLALALSLAGPQVPGHDPPHLGPMFLPAVSYGTPLRLSAGLSVFLPAVDLPGGRRDGFIVEAAAGQGGARLAFGHARFLEYVGVDARLVAARTWDSPRGASAKSTYGGVEAGLTLAYVRVSAGVARRLAGPDGPDKTIFTWSAGFQYPIPR